MHWVHLGPNDEVLKKEELANQPAPANVSVLDVSKDVYDIVGTGWKFRNGQWFSPSACNAEMTVDPLQVEINEIQEELRATDWIVVEILEFQHQKKQAPHDMQEIYEQRQKWRARKAELEKQLALKNKS